MPLYITSKYSQTLNLMQNDLWAMVNYATNFGTDPFANGRIHVYIKNPDSSLPQQILRRLSEAPFPILVVGLNYNDVPDASVLNGGPPQTISQMGGAVTHANYAAHNPADPTPPVATVEVEYDASSCNGEIYWAQGSTVAQTPAPPYIMLAHEFGHLVGSAIAAPPTMGGPGKDKYGNPGYGADELVAIGVENGVRKLYHCPLRTTDINKITIGGCGYHGPACTPPNMPKNPTTTNTGASLGRLCFVVTAAHGGQATPVLNGLRTLRDRLLKSSRLGQLFFGDFDEEYYLTSSAISFRMQQSPALRHAIRRWLVEPLTAFLATSFALVSRNRVVVLPELLRMAQPRWPDPRLRLAADLIRRLRCVAEGGADTEPVTALDPLGDAFRYLRATLQSYPRPPLILSWALLQPLGWLWTAWADSANDPWDDIERFICAWLRRMPLPRGYEREQLDNLAADLQLLKTGIFSDAPFFESLLDGIQARLAVGHVELMHVIKSARRA
jgi:hypothetical protein